MSNGTTNIDDLPISSTSIKPGQSFLGQSGVNNTNNIKLELSDKNVNMVIKEQHHQQQPQSLSVNNELQHQQQQQQQQQLSNNALDINQFISGIQKASTDGALSLPQRDIPNTQHHITQDKQIQANYIPSQLPNGDYINQYIPNNEILRKSSLVKTQNQAQDDIYNELQIPLLIFILYFIFNLPFIRKNMFTYLPMLFNKDGNLTGGGHLFHGIAFSLICFGVFKGIKYLSI